MQENLAEKIYGPQIAYSAKRYARARDLRHVIAVWPHELADMSADGTRKIITQLERAAQSQRNAALNGSWTYDTNKHLAVLGAIGGELIWLARVAGNA